MNSSSAWRTAPWTECLKGYIVEDSLYLREYAKVFAWGMTKAEDMDAIRSYYSLLSFVNEGEGAYPAGLSQPLRLG